MDSKENARLDIPKINDDDTREWLDSLEHMLEVASEKDPHLLEKLMDRLRREGLWSTARRSVSA